MDYRKVNISILSDFVGYLRNPFESNNILGLKPIKSKRTEKTVNLIITAVTNFYDFLFRTEEMNNDIIEQLIRRIFIGKNTSYKSFLHHINESKPTNRNILKIKEPTKKLKTLTKDDVEILYNSTSNIRDKFLIKLLFESGLRIGEALSLFIEDFIYDHKIGHKIKLVDRGELPNGGKLKTDERELYISQELMDLFDDYEYEILDEINIDTNFVFVKLRGSNLGQPMNYSDVNALFRRLKHKTGIDVHAHLLRHTHATIYYHQTKDIK